MVRFLRMLIRGAAKSVFFWQTEMRRKKVKISIGIVTDVFHSVVLQSLGTDSGSSLQLRRRSHRSYMGWAYTGLLASLFLMEKP